jgi:MFS family permease
MSWYGELDARGKRTFWACFGGWTLDAMDVQIYALVMPTLIGLWGLSKGAAGMLGTAALVASALGGVLAGQLADRVGRVAVLQVSVLWFSAFTFLSGFAQDYAQLLTFRVLQGIGFGGEWAAGAVLIAEVVGPRNRGKAVAAVSSGWAVGYGVAAIITSVMFSAMPADRAWRAMFFLGILPALLIVYVRRAVTDSEVFLAEKTAREEFGRSEDRPSLGAIFRNGMARRTAAAWLVCLGVLGGNYTVLTWLPTYLREERGLSWSNTGLFLLVNIAGSFLGYILGGHVSDGMGRKPAMRLFAVLGVASVVSYLILATSSTAILVLGFPLGFAQSAMNSGVGPLLSELYPTRLRATGQGFSYNAGRGVGAAFPALVGLAASSIGLTTAITLAAAAAYALVILASFALPETRGRLLFEGPPR